MRQSIHRLGSPRLQLTSELFADEKIGGPRYDVVKRSGPSARLLSEVNHLLNGRVPFN